MNSVIFFEVFQEEDGGLITKCLTEDICSRSRCCFPSHPRKSRPTVGSTCRNDCCRWLGWGGHPIALQFTPPQNNVILSRMEVKTEKLIPL